MELKDYIRNAVKGVPKGKSTICFDVRVWPDSHGRLWIDEEDDARNSRISFTIELNTSK